MIVRDHHLMQPTNNNELNDFLRQHVIFVHVTTPTQRQKNVTTEQKNKEQK